MPIGYLISVALVAWCTLFALAPPRPRQSGPSNLSYRFGFLVNDRRVRVAVGVDVAGTRSR